MIFKQLGTEIAIEASGFDALDSYIRSASYSRYAVITSEPMASLYGPAIMPLLDHSSIISLAISEETKTLNTVERCWLAMRDAGLDRRSLVIALGGGTVTDIAGFASATYMRGIDYVNIPTSLLSMVDAALGGKTGVNLGQNKNFIGAVHQPKRVLINIDCLRTLPVRELRSGMAEMIKAGVIWDADYFTFLEDSIDRIMALDVATLVEAIQRACEIKMTLVSQDPYDNGVRALLNFGHTSAHALEGLTGYMRLLHGEAVAIGMVCAARLAVELSITEPITLQRIEELCRRVGLPTTLPSGVDPQQLIHLMRSDKKAQKGSIVLLLPRSIGHVEKFTDVTESAILESLSRGVCCG